MAAWCTYAANDGSSELSVLESCKVFGFISTCTTARDCSEALDGLSHRTMSISDVYEAESRSAIPYPVNSLPCMFGLFHQQCSLESLQLF